MQRGTNKPASLEKALDNFNQRTSSVQYDHFTTIIYSLALLNDA